MKVFEHPNPSGICPICKTNEDKPCVLIGIDGTQEDNIIQCNMYHLECIDLTEYKVAGERYIMMKFGD